MENEYRRLPGRRLLSLWGTDSLWLGKDHILSIKKRGYTEEYRRFYFGDVQAILVNQTVEGTVWTIVLGIITAALIVVQGFAWLVWEWEFEALILWGVLVFLFAAMLLTNILKGSTCKAFIRTAVQMDPLPSLHRVRTARKMIERVRPFIEANQGSVPREKLISVPFEFSVPVISEKENAGKAISIHHEKGTFHQALFAMLIANAVVELLDLYSRSITTTAIGAISMALILFLMIGAAMRQRNSDMKPGLKRMVWFSLALFVCLAMGHYAEIILFAILNPGSAFTGWGILQAMMERSPLESTFSIVLHIFAIAGSLILGIVGMILWTRHRTAHRLVGKAQIQDPPAPGREEGAVE